MMMCQATLGTEPIAEKTSKEATTVKRCAIMLCLGILPALAKWASAGEIHIAAERGDLPPAEERRPTDAAHASALGDIAQVKKLLSKGSNINARDRRGQTPLHLAAICEHADVADLLLTRGADPTIKDDQHRTPLAYAREYERRGVISIFQKHGVADR